MPKITLRLRRDSIQYSGKMSKSRCQAKELHNPDCGDKCGLNAKGNADYIGVNPKKSKDVKGGCARVNNTGRYHCFDFDGNKSCKIGNSLNNENPLVYSKQDKCELYCTYEIDKIDTRDQWKTLMDKIEWEDGQQKEILKKYCTLTSESCPLINNSIPASCSRMTSKDYRECNVFNTTYNEDTDAMKNEYAANNEENPDTACLLRTNDEVYNQLKVNVQSVDSCWYKPCTSPTTIPYLSDLNKPECPKEICQQIYQIAKANKVDISGNKNIISCGNTPVPSPKPSSSKKSNKIIMLVSIIGGIMFLLLFGFLLYRSIKKKASQKKSQRNSSGKKK